MTGALDPVPSMARATSQRSHPGLPERQPNLPDGNRRRDPGETGAQTWPQERHASFTDENCRRDQGDSGAQPNRKNRLQPGDIMNFDPAELNVAFFIRRCEQIAEMEGERAVLRVLPRCLKGEALEWYTSLASDLRTRMNHGLSEWSNQLLRQFQVNRFDALRDAEKLRFRFDCSDTLSLSRYFIKKVNLLKNAGITDLASIVQHLHTGLNAHLALVTQYNKENTIVEGFIRAARFHEPAARRLWAAGYRKESASRPPVKTYKFPGLPPFKRNIKESGTYRYRLPPLPRQDARKPLALHAPGTKPAPPKLRPRGKPFRPCRHCGGDHYDPDCPTMRRAARAYQIAEEEFDDPLTEQSDSDKESGRNQPRAPPRPYVVKESENNSGKESDSP